LSVYTENLCRAVIGVKIGRSLLMSARQGTFYAELTKKNLDNRLTYGYNHRVLTQR
jgi:hypothetical protein